MRAGFQNLQVNRDSRFTEMMKVIFGLWHLLVQITSGHAMTGNRMPMVTCAIGGYTGLCADPA